MAIVKVKPRLSEILAIRKMTQLQLAELAKIPQGSISRFDYQESHNDNHKFSIAHALGLNVEDLFRVIESPENEEK